MTGAGQPDTRAIMVTFTADDYRRLIHADHLAETGDLAEFTRRAAMDKVGLIERLAGPGFPAEIPGDLVPVAARLSRGRRDR